MLEAELNHHLVESDNIYIYINNNNNDNNNSIYMISRSEYPLLIKAGQIPLGVGDTTQTMARYSSFASR